MDGGGLKVLKTGCIGLMSPPNGQSTGAMGCGSATCMPILAGTPLAGRSSDGLKGLSCVASRC